MIPKRIVVAMSGGVDSSVAAALLKEEGHDVIGITMNIWESSRDLGGCCGIKNIEDAKKVARKIGIPHYVVNFRDIFRSKVVEDFCREYKRGRTPNPCIRCNKYIKFEALINKAKQLDADYISTGHYARIVFDKKEGKFLLKKGLDRSKDQSYVLYMMTQEQLGMTLMPLGAMAKSQIRKIAREKGLAVAEKEESQEICFIPDNNYEAFIKKYAKKEEMPGVIVDTKGKVIGRHRGIISYTVGQRRGLGIAAKYPLYVVAINSKANTIIAGPKQEVYGRELIADDISLINMKPIKSRLRVKARIRYLHNGAMADLIPLGTSVRVVFDKPQWAITPGQSVVFYRPRSPVVIGGGIIKEKVG
ncbi:MAG: tRNA 2-thiouridine(34) synthase MnmA [bacterium]